ncbi:MAG: hypothetical protein EXR77_20335 [Myxococcales bacterium]|nr:hypothetical protein [Myxococcales bacterium]
MAGGDRFSFLGREFLTWLWFESERSGGRVATADGEYGVDFAQRLVLESGGTLKEGSSVQSEAPAQAQEARTALRVGKKVAKARLVLDVGDKQFTVNLDAETLALSNAKLPTVLGLRDAAGLDERVGLLDQLEAVVDGLYLHFVRLRKTEQSWAPVREAMRAWVATPPQG